MGKNQLVWAMPVCLAILIIFSVQFSQTNIIGADGHLHGRLSLMMVKSGFIKILPQAHFSWFATRYSDKDFFYHLYLVPLVTIFGYTVGTKVGALLAASTLAAVVIYLLKIYGRNQWISWSGLLMLASYQFLRDTAEARPVVLAILLTILGIHALVQKKSVWVFTISLIYGMTHLSGWLLTIIAIAFATFEWISTGKRELRLVMLSVAGWGISFILHPNFPNNIFYFYLNGILVPYYAAKTGVLELGAEFFPLFTHELLQAFPMLVAGSIILVILQLFSGGGIKLSQRTCFWSIACLVLLPMGLVAKRNLTHLYPVAVIFLASATAEAYHYLRQHHHDVFNRLIFPTGIAGLAICLFAIWQTIAGITNMLISERIYSQHFAAIAGFINKTVPKSSRIFHTNWSDSQYLIGLAPDYEYIVTLDPIYMFTYNQNLYNLYRNVSFGQSQNPYDILKETFGVRWGYAGKNYFNAFIEQVRHDSRFSIEGEDQLGIVFSLK